MLGFHVISDLFVMKAIQTNSIEDSWKDYPWALPFQPQVNPLHACSK